MKNWIQRLAIFAVVGTVLSSAVLMGCGGSSDDAATPTPAAKDDAASE